MDLPDQRPLGRALRQLRRWLEDGSFIPGGRLPGEGELAQRIGVSRFTVHRALEELAGEGGIRPLARRGWLRPVVPPAPGGCLDRMVAIVGMRFDLGELDSRRALADAVQVYAGALAAIGRAGLHAAVLQPDRALAGDVDALAGGGLHGLLLMPEVVDSERMRAWAGHLARLRMPVVAHGEGRGLPGIDQVLSDHAAGCAALVRWLAGRGCRRILRLRESHPGSGPWPGWLADRDAGYRAGCGATGIAELPWLTVDVPTPTLGGDSEAALDMKSRIIQSHLHDLLAGPQRPDAILVPSDRNAFTVARALRRLGVDPRRQLPVCGYDCTARDCVEGEWESFIPAASVDRDCRGIGARMVEVVVARRSDPSAPAAVHRHPPRLVPDLA